MHGPPQAPFFFFVYMRPQSEYNTTRLAHTSSAALTLSWGLNDRHSVSETPSIDRNSVSQKNLKNQHATCYQALFTPKTIKSHPTSAKQHKSLKKHFKPSKFPNHPTPPTDEAPPNLRQISAKSPAALRQMLHFFFQKLAATRWSPPILRQMLHFFSKNLRPRDGLRQISAKFSPNVRHASAIFLTYFVLDFDFFFLLFFVVLSFFVYI